MAATRRMEFIARTQLTGTAASVSFANLDTDFRKFFVVAYLVKDGTANEPLLRINNDSGANYVEQELSASGATVAGERKTAQTSIELTHNNSIAANTTGLFVIEISKPVAAEVARMTCRAGFMAPLAPDAIMYVALAAEWTNTADLISRIDLIPASGNFTTGTRILLAGSRD